MTTVQFFTTPRQGGPRLLGSLTWTGSRWTSTGEPWIAKVIEEPIWGENGQEFVAADNPLAFLANLSIQFRNAYCYATRPTVG